MAYVTDGPRSLPLLPLKFGQNRPVTAEIFMIWTNVARTNVAWTNVAWSNITVTVGIYSGKSQEPTFEVWSKSGK